MSSGVSKTDYTYDALGRPLTSTQTTGDPYSFSYTWNAASALTSVTYPSGKTVNYCFDSAYRPVGVRTGSGSCTPGTAGVYAGNGSYAPHGALAQLQLGNSLWETAQFNSRLQPSAIKLGTSAGSDGVFGSALDYGTTNNNGNVLSQTITGSGLSKTQTYTYDGANRLSVASESGSAWSRNFGDDAKSNGWVSSWTGISPASFTPQSSAWFNSNNQLVNAGVGIEYDGTGNQTAIGGYSFTFDAESRLATSTINTATTTNVYDGEGRRVKKVAPDQSQTVYVYNAMGQLAAEYASNPPAGGGTICLTADHLGSTRVATSATGTTLARRDYLPFGEEIPSGIGSRTSLWSADMGATQKFTGKERDAETGLDYFGARYLSSAQGRFTSPDPITVTSGRVVDPQQLNLYAYARNNPLKYVDPTGMIIDLSQLSDEDKKKWAQIQALANQKDANGNYVNAKLQDAYSRLDSDSRTFVIVNENLGAGTAGQFTITNFNGPNDFSEAKVALNFKTIGGINSTTKGDLDPSFMKYEGLLGKNGFIPRLAETFGHEAFHGIFALDNLQQGTQIQRLLNDRDAALQTLPAKGRYPLPPDVLQKMQAADNVLIPTERFAQQAEKIINGELKASQVKK